MAKPINQTLIDRLNQDREKLSDMTYKEICSTYQVQGRYGYKFLSMLQINYKKAVAHSKHESRNKKIEIGKSNRICTCCGNDHVMIGNYFLCEKCFKNAD